MRTDRRHMLGALALAPVIIAAPAVAVEPSRHGTWLAQYQDAYDAFEARSEEEQQLDSSEAMFEGICAIEKRILSTPVRSATEARDKLRFGVLVHAQGVLLDADDAAELMTDVGRFLV